MDLRAELVMEKSKVSKEEALKTIEKIDQGRKKWSSYFYGISTFTPELYDMVFKIQQMTSDDAAEFVYKAISFKSFVPTDETFKAIEDRIASVKIKRILMDIKPDMEVTYNDGIVKVKTELPITVNDAKFVKKIRELCNNIPDVKVDKVEFEISVLPTY